MRVLLAEDERALAEVTRRGLVAQGFDVEVVHDGQSALWRARESDFDVVLLDIMMPGLNGYEVLERLRQTDSDTPVLMLTALDDDFDQAHALDLGADDFLSKPFGFVVLVARIRALARRRGAAAGRGAGEPAASAQTLVVGDLVIDPLAHRVTRQGTDIELTRTEFDLLLHLAQRAGQVVTKTQLLDSVWEHRSGDGNVVEVYVGYLRRKIDVPFGRRTIETVRGLGYRLSVTGG